MELFKIFLAAVFVKNIVFIRFLALCSFIGMTSDVKKSTGMGWAVLFVTVIATAATYPLYKLVLAPYNLGFLQTLLFILVIASLVQLVEFYLKKSAPALYSAMGVYSIGVALSYMLAMVLFAGLRERIDIAPIPKYLKGTPILFIAAALLSLAFGGFAGMI